MNQAHRPDPAFPGRPDRSTPNRLRAARVGSTTHDQVAVYDRMHTSLADALARTAEHRAAGWTAGPRTTGCVGARLDAELVRRGWPAPASRPPS